MKKLIKYLLVITFIYFLGILSVNASEECTSVTTEIDNYNTYVKLLNSIDCTDNADESNVATCNEFNVRKNLAVTKIMKVNDENNVCKNEKSKVNKIIKENKDNCGKIFNDDFNDFVNKVMVIFYILGPILLIFFGSLDYAKATVSSEADALKKANTRFAKRLAATLLLFLTPTLVNLVISFNVSDKYLSGNAYTCGYKYLVYNKKYTITYVPITSGRSSSTSYNLNGGTIVEVAEKVHNNHRDSGWHYSVNGTELIYNDIERQSNNPNKAVCCASFVAEVLYRAGIFTAEELNSSTFNYHWAPDFDDFLEGKGWTKITDYNSMQPGDIAVYSGHVQIYAGKNSNGTMVFFSEGSDEAVKEKSYVTGQPYTALDRSTFLAAYRQP